MIEVDFKPEFSEWRIKARSLLAENITPTEIHWLGASKEGEQSSLFRLDILPPSPIRNEPTFKVPKTFIQLAPWVAAHRDSDRWDLLYRILWRLKNENPNLMHITVDNDVYRFMNMYKQTRRDAHKMKAFVRFKRKPEDENELIAWHNPDHYILKLTAPFFARRFSGLRWTILTPYESVRWDGKKLNYFDGVPRHLAPKDDSFEEMWRSYYKSIFNPARIKVKMMKTEMPVRHWATLPESRLIAELIRESPAKLISMFENQPKSASEFVPQNASWEELKTANQKCTACEICPKATAPVFGAGNTSSQIVFIGEQPGDQEDKLGIPFVGPAGEVLNRALKEVGLNRDEFYFTNAVKGFKWRPQDAKRLHVKPLASDVATCKSWLEAELNLIAPKIIVCLGASAAHSVLGRTVRMNDVRGKFFSTKWNEFTFVTVHPSFILRSDNSQLEYQHFVKDLSELKRVLEVLKL